MSTALDNGTISWAIGLGLLFAFDGYLVATGHRSMSSHARAHPTITAAGLAALVAHLAVPARTPT